MGDDISPYMAYMMRMQGQAPKSPWTIIEHLRQQYEVKSVPTDVNEINDVDILLVIHPKNLPEQTLFAIDQFVLKGGRMIVCVDPYCYADQQNPMAGQFGGASQGSNLNKLLNTWGLDMPGLTFAGDRNLTDQRAEKIIGFLGLKAPMCFSHNSVITAQLNIVRVWFAGVLNEINSPNDANGQNKIERTPLTMTTAKGNSFKVDNPMELQVLDSGLLMQKFTDGNKPVVMGYLVSGKFKTSFPNGIEAKSLSRKDVNDANAGGESTVHIAGLTEATGNCAVAVFSDVDFISDMLAYQKNPLFGAIIVGDNSALLLNAIDDLVGSSDLISIRSRGNFQRPFTVVDDIEAKADAETAGEVAKLNDEIAGLEDELKKLVTSKDEKEKQIIGSSIVQKTRGLELKKLKAQRQLREVRMQRRQRIEHLGNVLRNFNMLAAPAVILIIAVTLGVKRSVTKRHYISHASDA
jgi:ABC-type uncharacterized transport system involved in gliding motility auxiliary subunit